MHKTVQPSCYPWVKYLYVFTIFFPQKQYTFDSAYREILVSHSVLHCLSLVVELGHGVVFYHGCLLVELSTFGCSCFAHVKTDWLKEAMFCLFSLFVAKKRDGFLYRSSHLPCFSPTSDLAQFHLPFNVPIPVLHLSPFSAFPLHSLEQLICNIKHMATFIEGKWVEKSNLLNDSSSGSSGTSYHGRWWWASEITPSRQEDRRRERTSERNIRFLGSKD